MHDDDYSEPVVSRRVVEDGTELRKTGRANMQRSTARGRPVDESGDGKLPHAFDLCWLRVSIPARGIHVRKGRLKNNIQAAVVGDAVLPQRTQRRAAGCPAT